MLHKQENHPDRLIFVNDRAFIRNQTGICRRWSAMLSFVLLVFLNTNTVNADSTKNLFGSWNSLMLTGDLGALSPDLKSFRWLLMDQVRTRDDSARGTRFSENLLWAQLGYQINQYTSVWLGYTHAWIDPLAKSSFQENRPYQDVLIKMPFLDGKWMSRTRFEQRINQSNGSTGLRMREWIQYRYPLSFVSDQLSFYAGDEVLFYLNRSTFGSSGFTENRVIAGLTYYFNVHWGADLGYLGQYVVNDTGRDLFSHNLMANIRYRF